MITPSKIRGGTEMWPTLYKKVGKKMRYWYLKTTPDAPNGRCFVEGESGVMGTAKPVRSQKYIENSSTIAWDVRTVTHVEAKYKDKRKKGYCNTPSRAEKFIDNRPMKYGIYVPGDKVTFPIIGTPKLDGIHCIADSENEWKGTSREGNVFEHLKGMHSYFQLAKLPLNGELYEHGKALSDIVSDIKSPETIPTRLYLFDIAIPNVTLLNRLKMLLELPERPPWIEVTSFSVLNNQAELDAYFKACLDAGFEGIMLKDPNGYYEHGKRSKANLKWKPVDSEEFEITGIEWEHNATMGKNLVVFQCVTGDRKIFKAVPKWKKAVRALTEAEASTLIGKKLTVEYRGLTKYGVPFHPVGIAVRDYE